MLNVTAIPYILPAVRVLGSIMAGECVSRTIEPLNRVLVLLEPESYVVLCLLMNYEQEWLDTQIYSVY